MDIQSEISQITQPINPIKKHLVYFSYLELDKTICTKEFKEYLICEIHRELGHDNRIACDKNCFQGDMDKDQLKQFIRSTEIFLCMSSRSYFNKKAKKAKLVQCIEELSEFLNEYGKTTERILIMKTQPLKQKDITNKNLYDLYISRKGYIFYEYHSIPQYYTTYRFSSKSHEEKIQTEIDKITQDIRALLEKLEIFYIGITLANTIVADNLEELEPIKDQVQFYLERCNQKNNKFVFKGYKKDVDAAISEYEDKKMIEHIELENLLRLEESGIESYLDEKIVKINHSVNSGLLAEKVFQALSESEILNNSDIQFLLELRENQANLNTLNDESDIFILIYQDENRVWFQNLIKHYKRLVTKGKKVIVLNFTSENIQYRYPDFIVLPCSEKLGTNFISDIKGLL